MRYSVLVAVMAVLACAKDSGSGNPDGGSGSVARRSVTIRLSVSGPGELRSAQLASDCRGDCQLVVDAGTAVHLDALPDAKAFFKGFGGACAGGGSCDLTAQQDTLVSAAFETAAPVSRRLEVVLSGIGTVRSDPAGIDCPGRCTAQFDDGTVVRITATPDPLYDFAGFGGGCSGPACSMTIGSDQQIRATFTRRPVTLTVQTSAGGRVVSDPAGIDCPPSCAAKFAPGMAVALTPAPAPGYRFAGFDGACRGTGCLLNLSGDAAVTATFSAIPSYRLAVAASGSGGGRVTSTPAGIDCPGACSAAFLEGTQVSLAATPDVLSRLGPWMGACSGYSCGFTVTADTAAVVQFDQRRYAVQDLGSLTGSWSNPNAISPHNLRVVGGWGGGNFYWDGVMHNLGPLGDMLAVNDSGVAAGFSHTYHAFSWHEGRVTDLSTPGEMSSFAYAINQDGIVVGWVQTPDAHGYAVYWKLGSAVRLGSLASGAWACGFAYGINSDGIIVGNSCTPVPGIQHAVRYRSPGVIDDLGALPGGTYSNALAISDSGFIVGESNFANGYVMHGFFLADGQMTDAGTLPGMKTSTLRSVNSAGAAVGIATDGGSQMRGILYGAGRMVDLNAVVDRSSWFIGSAEAIDEQGNIIAQAVKDNSMHAVILRPE